MKHLDISIVDGLATVSLNRPEKRNALTEELFNALYEAGVSLQQTPGLRAVIITGAGADFCAGIDLQFLQSLLPRLDEIRAEMRNLNQEGAANWFQRPCYIWRELQVPVIAAIDGVCIGAGLQLALCADIRLVGLNTRMSIMEAKWGLIPDMGITQALPQLMRVDQAKELMMTARMMTAETAQQVGLATRIVEDPLAAAQQLAFEIMSRSPEAVNGSKALIDQTWTLPMGEGLAIEGALQADIIGTPNQMESVMAGTSKRAPLFK